MSKWVHNDVLDAALDIINNATIMTACSQQPTTRTQAITTYKLADVAITGADFTISDGDSSGRKVRVAAQSDIPIDTTGNATHIALCDGTDLLYVTTCNSQSLTSGNNVNFPAWDIEFADPA